MMTISVIIMFLLLILELTSIGIKLEEIPAHFIAWQSPETSDQRQIDLTHYRFYCDDQDGFFV